MVVSSLVCLLIFLLNAQPAFSSIIINEVSPRTNPEWIELYNTDPNPIDLTGWYFKDASGTKKLITNSEPFSPNTYYLATGYTSWLNNTGSESLYLFNNTDVMIDSVSFEETREDTVLARVPDIIGNWLLDQLPTPLAANIQPSPSPTPPPSPEPTPTVQSSPTPTPTPTPTPLPSTLASAQKPSPSPTPTPSKAPSPSPTSTPARSPSASALVVDEGTNSGTVAGEATIDLSGYKNNSSVSPNIKTESKDDGLTLNKSRAKTLIYIGSGLTLLSLAIYLWFRRKNEGIINR